MEIEMPIVKTIEDLRREIEQKEKLVRKLQARREKIAARLEKIDRKIAQLTGSAAPVRRGRRPAGVAAPAVAATPASKGKRSRGLREASLPAYIVKVLQANGKPMRALDVQKAVLAAGYPTKAKDFYGMVATGLRNKKYFKKVRRGVYKLA
jgi:hypothetical protein